MRKKKFRLRQAVLCSLAVSLSVLAGCAGIDSVKRRLRQAFPGSKAVHPMNLPSSRPAQVVAAWTVSGRDVPAGYGLRVRGRSRSGTFTALIVLDAGFLIRDVDVERYRGVRGSEIRRRSFQNQFRGKTPNAELRIGKGVDAVTGATISSKAFTDAVRSGARWLKMFCNRS